MRSVRRPRARDARLPGNSQACAAASSEQHERDLRRERTGSGFDVTPEEVALQRGSHDTGDPTTTNLYVGNLAPSVDEHALKLAFGKFGPIASVKIMWPRDDEQRSRGRMSGFVAFMTRRSAEDALAEMQGRMLHECDLRLGWSKAVPLPAMPCWPPPAETPSGFGPAAVHTAPVMAPLAFAAPAATRPPAVDVRVPRTAAQLRRINMLASYVALDGSAFEDAVVERERGNPVCAMRWRRFLWLALDAPAPRRIQDFSFISDTTSDEHMFYKWRVFSLAQGDSLSRWHEEEFEMVLGGAMWKPPTMAAVADVEAAASAPSSSGVPAERELTDAEADAFEDALRSLTVERSSIRDAMLFALDHADAAGALSDTLVQALSLRETPAATKVARLFLLSDILHNSGAQVRNAAAYRAHLVSRLPDVFESLRDAYSTLDSRIAAQALRRHVTAVLRAWADWFIFGEHFLAGLEATFLRSVNRLPEDGALRAQLERLTADDLERRCRESGVSVSGDGAARVSRLLAVDCFRRAQRGEVAARNEDEPTPEAHAAAERQPVQRESGGSWVQVPFETPSRWTSVDAAEAPIDGAVATSADADAATQPLEGSSSAVERASLRHVEIELVLLREQLTSGGCCPGDVETRVAARRAELLTALHAAAHGAPDTRKRSRSPSPGDAQDKRRG